MTVESEKKSEPSELDVDRQIVLPRPESLEPVEDWEIPACRELVKNVLGLNLALLNRTAIQAYAQNTVGDRKACGLGGLDRLRLITSLSSLESLSPEDLKKLERLTSGLEKPELLGNLLEEYSIVFLKPQGRSVFKDTSVYRYLPKVDNGHYPDVYVSFPPEVNTNGSGWVTKAAFSLEREDFIFTYGVGMIVFAVEQNKPAGKNRGYIFRRGQLGGGREGEISVTCLQDDNPEHEGDDSWCFSVDNWPTPDGVVGGRISPATKTIVTKEPLAVDGASEIIELLSLLLPDYLREGRWTFAAGNKQYSFKIVF